MIVLRSAVDGDFEGHLAVTEWSFIHRVAHGLNMHNRMQNFSDGQLYELTALINNAYGTNYKLMTFDYNDELVSVMSQFFTFKSARDNNITSVGEVENEVLTQYLYTGKVKMNTHAPNYIGNNKLLISPDKVRKRLLQMENRYNKRFPNIIDNMKGIIILV